MFFTDVNAFDALTDTTLIEDFEAFPLKNQPLSSFVSNGNTYTGHAGDHIPMYLFLPLDILITVFL
jgi:hypothetical protein